MSDYMFMLDSHLDAAQNRAVMEIQQIAAHARMNVWLTGGAMRDMLRGAPIRDLDFTVERDALRIGKALAQALDGKVTEEDSLKRWVELDLPGGIRASVANSRTEKYTKPGGKPQIAAASIHDDLSRRDFTINAIALSLGRGSRGLLVDPVNGQADLLTRELRATNPYVFFDDPARLFRLIRFQHTLGFTTVPRMESQVENALLANYQEHASPDALGREMRAVALDPNAIPMIEALSAKGLLRTLSPALTSEKLNLAGLARLEKQAHAVPPAGAGDGWLVFLHVLVEKLGARERTDVVRAFGLSSQEAARFRRLEAEAKALESALKSAKIHKASQVWEILEASGAAVILMVLYRSQIRVVNDRIRAFYEKYIHQAQEVTDEQVAATGAKPGSPKFAKARLTLIAQRLNARPRKVEVLEADPPVQAIAAAGGRGRK